MVKLRCTSNEAARLPLYFLMIIFLVGLECEVKHEFRQSQTLGGDFFDGTDDFNQVYWPGFVFRRRR